MAPKFIGVVLGPNDGRLCAVTETGDIWEWQFPLFDVPQNIPGKWTLVTRGPQEHVSPKGRV